MELVVKRGSCSLSGVVVPVVLCRFTVKIERSEKTDSKPMGTQLEGAGSVWHTKKLQFSDPFRRLRTSERNFLLEQMMD